MPEIKFKWFSAPPLDRSPALHITCLTNDKYHAPRWWDGQQWWDLTPSRGRVATAFKWPKGAAGGPFTRFAWMRKHVLNLRKITDQSKVRYGVPYKHFSEPEVLRWLVAQGRLPADWPEAFQGDMRAQAEKGGA